MEVCQKWQIKPTTFWLDWSETDKAYAMAFVKAKSMIQAWEQQLQEEQLERTKRKSRVGKSGLPGRRR